MYSYSEQIGKMRGAILFALILIAVRSVRSIPLSKSAQSVSPSEGTLTKDNIDKMIKAIAKAVADDQVWLP